MPSRGGRGTTGKKKRAKATNGVPLAKINQSEPKDDWGCKVFRKKKGDPD